MQHRTVDHRAIVDVSVAGPQSFEAAADRGSRAASIVGSGNCDQVATSAHASTGTSCQHRKNREFETVRRADVTALLDAVEDGAGPVAADRVLAILSRIFNWYAQRVEGATRRS